MRKAFFSLDMVASLVLFLMVVFVALYYAVNLSHPQSSVITVLKKEAFDFAQSMENNISWSVYMVPVVIDSENSSKASVEHRFFPESSVDAGSIVIVDENKSEINSSFEENTIIFTPYLAEGENNYYLIYTKGTSLAPRQYSTDLEASGNWVNNSLINVSFAATGLSKIEFNGLSVLQGAGSDLTTSGTPALSLSAVRAKKEYENGIAVKIFDNNSKILVESNHTFNPVIYVTKAFTNYYDGSVNSISSPGLQFNSIIDFLDIYGSSGISFIADSMNVSLYNNTYNEIRMYDVTAFEIYLHDGTYASALKEKDMYLSPPEVLLLMPEETKGVSYDLLLGLNSTPYASIKEAYSNGLDFNLSIYNISVGIEKPKNSDVIAFEYPVSVVDRFGLTENTVMNFLVWME